MNTRARDCVLSTDEIYATSPPRPSRTPVPRSHLCIQSRRVPLRVLLLVSGRYFGHFHDASLVHAGLIKSRFSMSAVPDPAADTRSDGEGDVLWPLAYRLQTLQQPTFVRWWSYQLYQNGDGEQSRSEETSLSDSLTLFFRRKSTSSIQ